MSFQFSFPRYLAAKKTVDDRALNQAVWDTLHAHLAPGAPWKVLEVGAGTGTMLERMLQRHLLAQAAYTGIDAQAENIDEARVRLPQWAAGQGFDVQPCAPHGFSLQRPGQSVSAHFLTADLWEFAGQEHQFGAWDLLVANAVLDLMDIPRVLPHLLRLLRPGGLFYFSINFDGATIFEPNIDPAFDALIQTLYHQTMDERLTGGLPSGDSRAGRRLFTHLRGLGANLLEAGASDWVVFAGPQGYRDDEAYFLACILDTLRSALAGHPQLDEARFTSWLAERQQQLARGELVYIAHQLDMLGAVP